VQKLVFLNNQMSGAKNGLSNQSLKTGAKSGLSNQSHKNWCKKTGFFQPVN